MTLSTRSAARNTGYLPADASSFVGRRRQVGEAKKLLPTSRLLTFTGPGGVGKTRLALRVAASVQRAFRDGIQFIDLAELREASLLAHRVAQWLDLRDQSTRSPLETVIEYLKPRSVLLILDNCEHLIDDCALFADAVIRACPQVRILATSRQTLGVYGETSLVIPPLAVPDPKQAHSFEAVAGSESVQLFADRASAVLPSFELTDRNCATVARLCRQLDGVPLAIELAVVWLRALSLQQIEERVSMRYRLLNRGPRAGPQRHQTLQAMVDWSYQLCSATEQRIWARASVFSGSFGLSAIEYVGADGEVPSEEVADIVDSLIDKSIVMREEHDDGSVRYRMLETLREYGQDQLVASGDHDRTLRRHRDWYAALTEQFRAEFIGPDQEAWAQRIRQEHPNLRIAMDTCLAEAGGAVLGLGIANRMDQYWSIGGSAKEGQYWLDRLLEQAPEPTPERTTALRFNAWYRMLQGDAEDGARLLGQAAELAEQLGFEAETAWVTLYRGVAACFSGAMEPAVALLSEALVIYRRVGDQNGEFFALFQLGAVLGFIGERERGLSFLNECLSRTTGLGDLFWRAYALWAVAFVEVQHGNTEAAVAAGKESLLFHHRMDNRQGIAFSLEVLAWVNERSNRHLQAATLLGAAAAVWEEIGTSPDYYAPLRIPHQEHIALAQRSLGSAAYEKAFEDGYALPGDEAIAFARGTGTKPLRRSADKSARDDLPLTRREREITKLVAAGMSNKDIAGRLVISPRTAEAHVQNILSKLGFTSRAQIAALFAAREAASPEADA